MMNYGVVCCTMAATLYMEKQGILVWYSVWFNHPLGIFLYFSLFQKETRCLCWKTILDSVDLKKVCHNRCRIRMETTLWGLFLEKDRIASNHLCLDLWASFLLTYLTFCSGVKRTESLWAESLKEDTPATGRTLSAATLHSLYWSIVQTETGFISFSRLPSWCQANCSKGY